VPSCPCPCKDSGAFASILPIFTNVCECACSCTCQRDQPSSLFFDHTLPGHHATICPLARCRGLCSINPGSVCKHPLPQSLPVLPRPTHETVRPALMAGSGGLRARQGPPAVLWPGLRGGLAASRPEKAEEADCTVFTQAHLVVGGGLPAPLLGSGAI
jgi:hypothetical protein